MRIRIKRRDARPQAHKRQIGASLAAGVAHNAISVASGTKLAADGLLCKERGPPENVAPARD